MARQVQVLLVLQVRLGQLEWELQVLLVQVARLDLMVQVVLVDRLGLRVRELRGRQALVGRVDPRVQVVQGLQDRQDPQAQLVQAVQGQVDQVGRQVRVDLLELSLPGKAPG